MRTLLFFLGSLQFSSCVDETFQPQFVQSSIQLKDIERTYWPTEGWQTAGEENNGVDQDKLKQAIAKYSGDGSGTDGILVIRNGVIVGDLSIPYGPDKLHYTWSIAKSVSDTLIGLAENDKLLERSQLLSRYFPEKKAFENLTIDHLLRMKTGLQWRKPTNTIP